MDFQGMSFSQGLLQNISEWVRQPSETGGHRELSKIRKLHRKKYQTHSNTSNVQPIDAEYFRPVNFKQKTDLIMKVEVKEMPEKKHIVDICIPVKPL